MGMFDFLKDIPIVGGLVDTVANVAGNIPIVGGLTSMLVSPDKPQAAQQPAVAQPAAVAAAAPAPAYPTDPYAGGYGGYSDPYGGTGGYGGYSDPYAATASAAPTPLYLDSIVLPSRPLDEGALVRLEHYYAAIVKILQSPYAANFEELLLAYLYKCVDILSDYC
jgi:hypothetical protein